MLTYFPIKYFLFAKYLEIQSFLLFLLFMNGFLRFAARVTINRHQSIFGFLLFSGGFSRWQLSNSSLGLPSNTTGIRECKKGSLKKEDMANPLIVFVVSTQEHNTIDPLRKYRPVPLP